MNLPRVIIPKRHVDSRGWFSETFREERLRDLGIDCRFVQDNQSYSRRSGTLRGLHFQAPPAEQAKLISVLRGRILDVAIDIRRGSPTFGHHVSIELSADVRTSALHPGRLCARIHDVGERRDRQLQGLELLRPRTRRRRSLGRPRHRYCLADQRPMTSSCPIRIVSFRCSGNSRAPFPMTAIRSAP